MEDGSPQSSSSSCQSSSCSSSVLSADDLQFCSTLRLLKSDFLERYRNLDPKLGFNGLGDLTYYRTYSRVMDGGFKEEWWHTIARVADETAWLLYEKAVKRNPKSDFDMECREKHKHLATKLFDKMFNLKFLPGGRGLWAMGTVLTRERKIYDGLSNCAFVSTKLSSLLVSKLGTHFSGIFLPFTEAFKEFVRPFRFTMEMLMLGVGVGFDTKMSESNISLYNPRHTFPETVKIDDSREGWVGSLEKCLLQYIVPHSCKVIFDYSKIRPAGAPLIGIGGVASGPEPLEDMHNTISDICRNYIGKKITERWVVDIMNVIGKTVVCGGIRRTAMIALGKHNTAFINLKDYTINPERAAFGWSSNNSVVVGNGDGNGYFKKIDYTMIADGILRNGEPGVFWIDNARKFGRLADRDKLWRDEYAKGTNPCGEQTLDSYELCNLVEVFPSHHNEDLSEFLETLQYALLYGKLVASLPLLYQESDYIVKQNKRIGISLTGIADFLEQRTEEELILFCDMGYSFLLEEENRIEEIYGIGKSIKLTTIKPSGTLSIIGGVCPGMHWPVGRYINRRVCLPENDKHIREFIKKKGIQTYVDPKPPHFTFAEIPIQYSSILAEQAKSRNKNIWQQIHMARLLQTYWSDNQVSCTITFDPESTSSTEIATFLWSCASDLKSISMLPLVCKQKYDNMPFEEITEQQYCTRMIDMRIEERQERESIFSPTISFRGLTFINASHIENDNYQFSEKDFCDSDNCFICPDKIVSSLPLTPDQ